MNLNDYRIYCNEVMNREELGEPASPEEFNIYVKFAVREYYREQYQIFLKAFGASENGMSLAYYQTPLKDLHQDFLEPNTTDGIITLPSDFKYPISARLEIEVDAANSLTAYRNARIVSPDQLNNALFADVSSIEEYPVVIIIGQLLEGLPNSFVNVSLEYFRTIDEPVFDYCIDNSAGNIIYMPVGSQLVANTTSGDTDLQDSGGTVLATDVSHVSNPTLPYTSQSVEIEFSDDYFTEIAGKIIEVMSAKDRDMNMLKYSKSEQQ